MNAMLTKVLIVEHSRVFQDVLARLMRDHGFDATLCANAESALKVCQDDQFDLICIAYHLPDISGEELCRQMRSNHKLKNSRIILLTAEDNEELLQGALLAGATDIYSKHDFRQFQTYIQRFAESQHRRIVGTVLLIEDSPSQLAWMATLLRTTGLSVDPFPNAEQALPALLANDYDVIITDVVLTGKLTGLNQVRAIRRLPTEKGLTPIFAVTAYDDASRRMELFHVGINDYMAKPINPEELLNRIANLIELQRSRKLLNQERLILQEMAIIDPLTKLYNRAALNQLLPKALANARRTQIPISLAIMDIDFFKTINDTYGHPRGDQVLRDIGEWLIGAFCDGDLVFRWGGEEFVIFLHNCTLDQSLELLKKQCQRMAKRKFANLDLTVSLGVSGIDADTQDASLEKLLEIADQALYQAKNNGRNRVITKPYSFC